jgi:hypothetical protein
MSRLGGSTHRKLQLSVGIASAPARIVAQAVKSERRYSPGDRPTSALKRRAKAP